jgi:hypothetical protein
MASIPPVLVTVDDRAAAELMVDIMGKDYGAVLGEADGEPLVEVVPIDDTRRGVVLYRVIQASRTVAARFPDAKLYLLTEEGSRWRLPPPAL